MPEEVTAASAKIAREIAITQRSPVDFNVEGVNVQAPLFVRSGELLFFQLFNEIGGALTVSWRQLLPNGNIVDNQQKVNVGGALSGQVNTITLTEGFLLSLSIYANIGGTSTIAYLVCGLTRDKAVAEGRTAILCQGYLNTLTPLSWPGQPILKSIDGAGQVRSSGVSQPAAGSDFIFTVPTGLRFQVHAIRWTFTTDANVISRVAFLQIDDGVNVILKRGVGTAQAAGIANNFNFANWGSADTVTSTDFQTALPPRLILAAGFRIQSVTSNKQVGDQYSNIRILAESWIEG